MSMDQKDGSAPQGADDALRQVGLALRALAEATSNLPRELRQLSAELLACQGGDGAGGGVAGERRGAGSDYSILAARFALSEATTAALALDRRIADAARHIGATTMSV